MRRKIQIALTGIGLMSFLAVAPANNSSATMDEIFGRATEMMPARKREIHAAKKLEPGVSRGASCVAQGSTADKLTFRIQSTNAVIVVNNMESGREIWPWFDAMKREAWVKLPLDLQLEVEASAEMDIAVRLTHADQKANKLIYSKPVPFALKPGTNTLSAKNLDFTCPAGIEIQCVGGASAGQTVTIRAVTFSADVWETYFRREIEIPKGDTIWQAIGSIEALGGNYHGQTDITINGQEVKPEGLVGKFSFHTEWNVEHLSLAGHLRSGKNVVGIHVRAAGSASFAYAWFQGAVVFASGRRIELDTGSKWKWSGTAPAGWDTPDYDDQGWAAMDVWDKTKRDIAGYVPSGTEGNPRRFNYKVVHDRPAYDGLILLENSADNKLFLHAETNVALTLKIPCGLATSAPVIKWVLTKYDKDGDKEISAASGAVEKFTARGDSLAFELTLPPVLGGIYLLYATLESGGQTVECREPEPLVFLAPLKMPEVPGDSYEQGMDLELETTIDFTHPADPHPWLETDALPEKLKLAERLRNQLSSEFISAVTEPAIVERDGLRYRETSTNNWAHYAYKVEFKHPGSFYLIALEYPDNEERWQAMACMPAARIERRSEPTKAVYANIPNHMASKCGPGIWTGGKYPVSGRMKELKWLYLPDAGAHTLGLINLKPGCRAAASGLKIYRVKGLLPSLAAPDMPMAQQRKIGPLTEGEHSGHEKIVSYLKSARGFYNTFSFSRRNVNENMDSRRALGAKAKPALAMCALLDKYQETCERFAEYLRFAGLNLYVMGCYMYDERNTPYLSPDGSARVSPCLHDFAARVFAVNDIDFLASVEFMDTLKMRAQVREGDANLRLQGSGSLNFMHSAVEAEMLRVADELGEKFKALPNFKGLNWSSATLGFLPTYQISYRKEEALRTGYDDITVGAFEKETGLSVPGRSDDPDKLVKRFDYLNTPENRERWIAWRAAKTHGFFKKLSALLKTKRSDLVCHASPFYYYDIFIDWRREGIPFADYARLRGWDAGLFADTPDIRLTPFMGAAAEYTPAYTWGHMRKIENYAAAWQANADMDFYADYQKLPYRSVVLRHWWVEVEHAAGMLPFQPGWPRPFQMSIMLQQRGDYAREPYTQAMIGMDPQTIMFGFIDPAFYIGEEQPLREFIRVFKRLPAEPFTPVMGEGFTNNLALRVLRKDGAYYFYAANPGYWPIEGTVTLSGANEVVDLVSGNVVAQKPEKSADICTVPVKLAPYGIAAFKTLSSGAKITGWKTGPVPEKELAHMRQIIATAEKLLADEYFKQLANYELVRDSTAAAAQALADGRYALAWSLLINDKYWDMVFRKGPIAEIECRTDKLMSVKKEIKAAKIGASETPTIDGRLDDEVWKQLKPDNGFVGQDKMLPAETRLWAAHDGQSIYIAFDCADQKPELIKAVAKEELAIFQDDVVAVFLRPNGGATYYQLAVNPAGVKLDQKNNIQGGRDYLFDADWQAAAARTEKGWSVEMKVSAASLGSVICSGAGWGANFHRGFAGRHLPVSWSWNADWHDTARQGTLVFE